VIVEYGRRVRPGSLPVFSTDTEEEAHALLTLSCPMNYHGQFVAPELVKEQTLDNLIRFSDRLQEMWDTMQKDSERHGSVEQT
jgi:hypothetical protein